MDVQHYTERHRRVAPQGAAQDGGRDGLQRAAHAGLQHRGVGDDVIVKIHTGHRPRLAAVFAAHKAKAVVTLHRVERGDMTLSAAV